MVYMKKTEVFFQFKVFIIYKKSEIVIFQYYLWSNIV